MDHKTRKMPSRLLCLCLVAVMLLAMVPANVLQAEAVSAGQIIYFKPNSSWKSDSARFAAYFFVDNSKNTWVSMTESSESGIYECTVPSGGYTSVIFGRMNPDTTANNFNNGTLWNQTADLSLPSSNNLFVANDGWSGIGGTWKSYTPPKSYYLVGYINGADYGCEDDYQNMGNYKFVNGKLTVEFTQDSYVFIKTTGNAEWYMTKSYSTSTSDTFYITASNPDADQKMLIPGGVEVTFTLTENSDGTLTLSYTKKEILYLGTTLYDYYTDYEVGGGNRANYPYDYTANYENQIPFVHLNLALSEYYKDKTARVPIYVGHFQPEWSNWEWKFQYNTQGLTGIYGFMDGKAYESDGDKGQKWFMSVNNSNLNLGPSEGHVYKAAHGIVHPQLSESGALLIDKNYDRNTTMAMPLFDEAFITKSHTTSKTTGVLGKVYKNVMFPFTKITNSEGVDVWHYDSLETVLQLQQNEAGAYSLEKVTNTSGFGNYNSSATLTGQTGFFPFNNNNCDNLNKYNYGFGARFDIKFNLTKDGKTEDGKDIIFRFSGDDDVWVFIDDQLVLDIGGCHGRVGGEINFSTMTATVDAVKSSGGDHNPSKEKSFTLKGMNTAEHTLTMFYMERGMWESNMMLEFNFFPVPETSMNVKKEWDLNANDSGKKQPVNVQLQSQDETGNWGDVGDPVELSENNQWSHAFTELDYDLKYRVVELNNQNKMIPNGGLTHNDLIVNYDTVTGDADKGYSQVITNKSMPAGQLRVTKAVANGSTGSWTNEKFKIKVTVDDSPISGTYTVEGGTQTSVTASGGVVELYAGETVVIPVNAGSAGKNYTVTEVGGRSPDYMASYTASATNGTANYTSTSVNGNLKSGGSASVTVTNHQVGNQVVVIDFGIPVDISVVDNVLGVLGGTLVGVGDAVTPGFGDEQLLSKTKYKAGDWHGTASIVTEEIDGKIYYKLRYTPADMKMNVADEIGYSVKYQEDANTTKYYHSTVTIIPATNIYYEDSFLTFENATGGSSANGNWVEVNEQTDSTQQTNVTQQQDRPGVNSALGALDANNIYGYDQAYDNFTTYSLGSAHKATVQGPSDPTSTDFIGHKDNAPTANFSFTGTGFDVVSLTSGDSGCLWVSVKDASGNPVRSIVVSNYYGYDYGLYNVTYKYDGAAWIQYINEKATENATEQKAEKPANPVKDQEVSGVEYVWAVVDNASDTLYQVPVIKVENLAHGTYTVEMKVVYLVSQDMQKTGSYTVYLDAIRVYNPAKGNDDVENHYKSDNEFEPTYVNIRDHIVNGIEENEYANGIGYVDGRHYQSADVGAFEGSYIDKYDSPSPNNEAYLMKDDGFVFKLRYYGEESPAGGQFHIGAKLATAGTATAAPRYATLVVTCQKETSWPTVQHKIQTCTSMFYKGVDLTWNLVTDGEDSYYETNAIYVRSADNTEGAILSLTDLKITLPVVVSASEDTVSEDDLKVIVDTEAAGFVKDVWDAEKELANPGINLAYPTLSLDGEVKYNFYYTIESNNIAIEDMGLITWSTKPEDATFAAAETVIPGAIFNAATGEYMVRTNGIPAKKLGDYLYFRVYAKLSDGSYVYSTLACYSAKYYAMDRLANSENANTKALCVAMLNYGAAAQMYFGYNTDNLMNADLTAEQKALVSAYSADMVDALTAADAAKTGDFVASGAFNTGYPSVSFEGAFAINYYFVPNKTIDGDLTLYCWDLETYNSVDKLTEDNATAKVVMTQTATGEYFGSYTGIAAKQIDETVFAAGVYESDGIRYSTSVVPYSVGTYCVDMAANGSDTMKAFAAETAVFGHYAKIYFDNLQK